MAILGYFKWLDKNLYIPYINDLNKIDDYLKVNRNIFNKQQYPPLSYGATSTGLYYQIFEPTVWRNDLSVLYKAIGSDTSNCGLETTGDGVFAVMPAYDYENTGLLVGFNNYQTNRFRIFNTTTTNTLNEQLEDEIYLAIHLTATNTYLRISQVSDGTFTTICDMLVVTVYDSEGTLLLVSSQSAITKLKLYDEIPPTAKPINFYANPTGYEANNGETVTPNFVMVYDDDTVVEPFTDITYDESRYFKDTISTLDEDGISITIAPDNTIKRLNYIVRPNVESEVNLYAPFHIDVLDAKNPYFPDGDSTTGGGGGGYGSNESYFGTSGLIPNGTVEENDSVGSMYTRYAMNLTDLNTIGNYFWSEELGLQVAKTIISLLYGDPVQTIISCVSYPFNIASLTGISGRGLRWGGHDTGLTMQALNSNGFQINWGTITVNEYWGNFLDYSPFTKFQLYLPWGTGFVDIDPNDVMRAKGGVGTTARGSGTLSVKTNVEVSRGMCVHHVIANDTVIGSYSGSCGRQIPITGSDYASKQVAIAGAAVGAMTSAAIGVGSAIREHSRGNWVESATGNVVTRDTMNLGLSRRQAWSVTPQQAARHGARVAANASRPAIAAAASVMVSPPHVSRSGSFQEGTGSLTIQNPYLIISRPRMSMPANYGNLYGYPSNIYLNLGSLSGYTEVGSIHLDGIPATMEELSEIDDLLKGGVIL